MLNPDRSWLTYWTNFAGLAIRSQRVAILLNCGVLFKWLMLPLLWMMYRSCGVARVSLMDVLNLLQRVRVKDRAEVFLGNPVHVAGQTADLVRLGTDIVERRVRWAMLDAPGGRWERVIQQDDDKERRGCAVLSKGFPTRVSNVAPSWVRGARPLLSGHRARG
jgi:hypothetical protein